MRKTISIILLGLILNSNSFAQQISYGYKTLGSTDVVSDVFLIQEGYKLDSLLYQQTFNDKLYKFGYYPDGKLKWDYNYMFFQEPRNRRTVSFPAYRIYTYNEEGKFASCNYFYWNGIVWIDKGGERYEFTYDDQGNILSKEYIGTNNGTSWRLEENTYDSNGNLTENKVTLATASYPTYNIWEYDSLNRLILQKSYTDSPNLHYYQFVYEYPGDNTIICTRQYVNPESESPITDKANYILEFDNDGKLINQQLSGYFDYSDSTWKGYSDIPFSYDDEGKAVNLGGYNRAHYNSGGNLDSLIIPNGGYTAGYLALRASLNDSYGNKITPAEVHGLSRYFYSELTPEIEKELTVTSMNNQDKLIAGDIVEITWKSINVEKVTIAFSPDSGTTWSLVAENLNTSEGSYSWSVPVTESNECLIRVSDQNTMNLYDECGSTFSITKELLLTSPNGNELWEVNTTHTISWETNSNTANIDITLSLDNGETWVQMADNISAATGSYDLIVPDTTSEQCLIKVTDSENSSISDESNNTFSIYRKEISLLTPNGGENLTASEYYDITWESEYIDNIKIELSFDSSETWLALCDSIPAIDQKFTLQLPELTSANCIIRISDLENANIFDESDNIFEIRQTLDIEDELSETLPSEYTLYQNYPNPFNPTTCIRYDIPEASFVSLKIFNLSGEEVAILVNEYKSQGSYQKMFDAGKLSSGIYFYTITAGSFTKMYKMVLMK